MTTGEWKSVSQHIDEIDDWSARSAIDGLYNICKAQQEQIEELQQQVKGLMKDSEPVHDMSDEMVKALFDRVNKKL